MKPPSITHRHVTVGDSSVKKVTFGNDRPFCLIAGPCVLESRNHAVEMAEALVKITNQLNIDFVFKSSFDKANRTSAGSARGVGMEKALAIFWEIRDRFQCPVVTDVHLPEQCPVVAQVVDLLQIPAFLCRQTDLLLAAAITGKPLNIKKGQFLAPWDMANVVRKVESIGHKEMLLCERGVSFGYNTLVSDMRSLPTLRATGYPVVFDATHSVQQPGGAGEKSSGQRQFVATLARAAVAAGVAALFIETHQDPDNAPSDGPNMIPIQQLPDLITILKQLDLISKKYPENILEN